MKKKKIESKAFVEYALIVIVNGCVSARPQFVSSSYIFYNFNIFQIEICSLARNVSLLITSPKFLFIFPVNESTTIPALHSYVCSDGNAIGKGNQDVILVPQKPKYGLFVVKNGDKSFSLRVCYILALVLALAWVLCGCKSVKT